MRDELEPGRILEGTISGLAQFGAFVDIGVGRDGLVHISQMSEMRLNKVEDVVMVGDKVLVRVLEVDPRSKRISLSMLFEAPEQRERELRSARAIADAQSRTEALTALAPHLSPEQQPAVLAEALAAALAIQDERYRTEALTALAPHLPPALLAEALQSARAIANVQARIEALTTLASHLPPDQQPAVLAESTRALQVGDRFRGKIIKVLPSEHIFLDLPKELHDRAGKTFIIAVEQHERADVVITAESHNGKGMKVGNVRWVEVVDIYKTAENRQLIEVKPTASPLVSTEP
jgi:predicted RNA-binding protein with RPS1 domain